MIKIGIFELWEDRKHMEHDTPIMGDCRDHGSSRKRCGRFLTMEGAKEERDRLVNEYLENGWRHMSSKPSTEERVYLLGYGNPGTIDLTLSLVQKL